MSQNQVSDESETLLRLAELICDEEEKTVLAAMRDDYSIAEEFAIDFGAECFYDPKRALLCKAMMTLAATSEPYEVQIISMQANRISMAENLGITVTPDYIRGLSGPVERARSYKGLLKDRAERRKLYDTIYFGMKNMDRMTTYELATEMRRRLEVDTPKSKGERIAYGATTQNYLKEELHKDEIRKSRGILQPKYPWPVWNQFIVPPDPGKITLFGAMDGVGKSTYAHRIAEDWARQGFSVAFVHAEDTLKKILKKRICHYAEIPLRHISVNENKETGEITFSGETEEENYELQDADRRIQEWAPNLHYVNMIGGTILDCTYELESMRKDGKCDIVIVDYIGAFSATRGQAKMEKSSQIVDEAQQLTTFSGRSDVPVFALAQGTKEMANVTKAGDISREHLYGGAALYQKAGTVILFIRNKFPAGSELRDTKGRLIASDKSYSPHTKIIIDKQNDDDAGTFNQFFEGRYYKIHDTPFWR